ncbi:N-acetylglucosamine kinase [Brachybacterium alimentarium]|uniref:N-acetylglucosamine kinase n=1 Tax=Brachybacterium alimentarium TaxID=47845 RepID=UPI000DF169A6|nr:BadF/BadG/BcrA/BcrD ATPase family protein [Brachybacterium alimentarium]RCS93450.1 N-acetylglucosamine kinase [Brachybacterium alimentarium]
MGLFLGMDGGGTKTSFVLIDEDRRVLATRRQPSGPWFEAGTSAVRETVTAGVSSVLQQVGAVPEDLDRAFFGFPGHGEDEVRTAELEDVPFAVLGHHRYRCGNDMLAGWAGALDGADGINVVAGTGSIAYGEYLGLSCRIGGWSEVMGDEGSAYWIAARGLSAFARMADGRAPQTLLHDLVRARLGISHDLDAIGMVMMRWNGERARIAALAPVVVSAAEHSDPVAERILLDAVDELVQHVRAGAEALEVPPTGTITVTGTGGVFSSALVRRMWVKALESEPRARHADSRHGPELGSALYALRSASDPACGGWS